MNIASVCTDCYKAHHYGYIWNPNHQFWEIGPDFQHGTDLEPLALLGGYVLHDATCSSHYHGQNPMWGDVFDHYTEPCDHCGRYDPDTGIADFSRHRCHGCGSTLGGSRYDLTWKD